MMQLFLVRETIFNIKFIFKSAANPAAIEFLDRCSKLSFTLQHLQFLEHQGMTDFVSGDFPSCISNKKLYFKQERSRN